MSKQIAAVSCGVAFFLGSFFVFFGTAPGATQEVERVRAIKPPTTALLPESHSSGIARFSFIAYGDTRGRRDGIAVRYEHSLIVDSLLAQIKRLQNTGYPVRFILQSGDAVVRGQYAKEWNVSFVPLIDHLTTEGGVPYFLAPGKPRRFVCDDSRRP